MRARDCRPEGAAGPDTLGVCAAGALNPQQLGHVIRILVAAAGEIDQQDLVLGQGRCQLGRMSDGVARLASDGDKRVTPVGKFIRKVRLDELPQLFNIFKGDMSVVGPRPERPEISREYEKEMPEFAFRLKVKAGLTGNAQVVGKYNTTPYDKLQMDLMYIAHPSLIEDLKIMLATVKILFMPESTEGVAEGATTAMGQEMK